MFARHVNASKQPSAQMKAAQRELKTLLRADVAAALTAASEVVFLRLFYCRDRAL
jgi:hypothetical protein